MKMLMNLMFMMIIVFVITLMLVVNFILSKKMIKIRDKNTSFECGFDSQSDNRLPFSLQFFLICILFLIFDVEIAMLLPMILSFKNNLYINIFSMMIIMLILLVGLYFEWKEGALKWFK